ncbi:ribonuclease III [Mycena polygramma]|nr:ribonuclease III [Mycena polygramma]
MGQSDKVFLQHMDAAVFEEPVNQGDKAAGAMEWKSSELHGPHCFTVIPEISSKELRVRVFNADPSESPKHEFEDPAADRAPTTENLKNLGESVLRLVVTSLILDMFPGLRVGPSTKLRELLIDNATLVDICGKFRFPGDRGQAPQHVQFKVFVGAIYLDQGLESVRLWLAALFRPYSSTAYNFLRDAHESAKQGSLAPNITPVFPCLPSTSPGSPASPLALLNECAQKGNRHVEWAYVNHPSIGFEAGAQQSPSRETKGKTAVWVAEVLVDGEVFGRGEGNTKKAARSEAAKQALPRLGVSM